MIHLLSTSYRHPHCAPSGVLETRTEKPPERPVDPTSRAQLGAAEVVQPVPSHMRVQMALACIRALEEQLVGFTAAAAQRCPALLGSGVRLELAAAAVLCEVLGAWACRHQGCCGEET